METRKIIVDRKKVSAKEIASRRDFDKIVSAIKSPPNPFWNSIKFWGATGTAALTAIFLTQLIVQQFNLKNNNNAYEQNITLTKNTTHDLAVETPCIQPGIEGFDVPYSTYELVSNEAQSITLENGSVIHIPENAFNASPTHPVLIQARLFEDKTSAFIAGVPMDYKDQAFESAGMIELRGIQNGKEVPIAEGKEILVDLILHKDPTENFGFYQLNEETGDWEDYKADYVTNDGFDDNAEDNAALNKLNAEIKSLALAQSTIETDLKHLVLPRKEDFFLPKDKSRQFQLRFDPSDYPELVALGDVVFEVSPDEKEYRNVLSHTWSDVNLNKKGENEYEAVFSLSGQQEKLNVRPVVSDDLFNKALNEYNNKLNEVQSKRKALQKESEALNHEREEKQAAIDKLIDEHKAEVDRFIAEEDQLLSSSDSENSESYLDKESKNNRKKRIKTSLKVGEYAAQFKTTKWGVFNSDRPIDYPVPFANPIDLVAKNKVANDIHMAYVFDLRKDVRYTYGTLKRSVDEISVNNNHSVILVVYKNGDIGFANSFSRNALSESGNVYLKEVKADELDEELLNELLLEDRITA